MTVVDAWSKSGLSTVLDGCSWQWWLGKVAGLDDPGTPATWRGTAVHAGVELHERARVLAARGDNVEPPGLQALQDHAVRVLHDEADDPPAEVLDRHNTSLAELEAQVQDALTNWYAAELKDGSGSLLELVEGWTPIAVEQRFRIPAPPSPRALHGFIDAIYWDPDAGEWVVVDVKTASRLGRWASASGHEREGSVYIRAALESAIIPASGRVRMEWHVVRLTTGKTARFEGARRVVFRPEPHHLSWLADDVARADRILAEGLFAPNPSWNLCSDRWCPFFRGCQVTGELAPGGAGLPAATLGAGVS